MPKLLIASQAAPFDAERVRTEFAAVEFPAELTVINHGIHVRLLGETAGILPGYCRKTTVFKDCDQLIRVASDLVGPITVNNDGAGVEILTADELPAEDPPADEAPEHAHEIPDTEVQGSHDKSHHRKNR